MKVSTPAGELEVIAELGDGFYLAATEGGPVVASKASSCVLYYCAMEPNIASERYVNGLWSEDEPYVDDDGLPFTIREKAIREYVKWTWHLAKHQLKETA